MDIQNKTYKSKELILIQYNKIDLFQNPNKRQIILYNQQVQMQQKKDNTGFNIRKVYKKHCSISKNPEQIGYYSPQIEFQKSHQPLTYTSKFKYQIKIRYQEIKINDTRSDSKLGNFKFKNVFRSEKSLPIKQEKKQLAYLVTKLSIYFIFIQPFQEVSVLKNQKVQLLNEKEKIRLEKKKIMQAIEQMKQKIDKIKQENDQKRQNVQNLYQTQAQYFNNLLLSMRFQAQYEHNIDPDRMTYEQLLQLQQKIGSVSKGLPQQVINNLSQIQIEQKHIRNQQKCTVCYCNFELKQIMTEINPCKHQFHFDCLKTWLMKQKVCPLCKQQLVIQIKQVEQKENYEQGQQNQQNNQGENDNLEQNQQEIQIIQENC